MKYITVVALLIAAVHGAGVGDLPECSQQCVRDAAKTEGCDADTVDCICTVLLAHDDTDDCLLDICGTQKATGKSIRRNSWT